MATLKEAKEAEQPLGFNARLAAAIAEMPNPVKDTKAYQYSYETLPQVLGIVQPALLKNGLYVMQGMVMGEEGKTCLITTIFDTMSNDKFPADSRPVHLVGDSRKDGSAETYARRYALKTVFGLAGEDDDGEAASEPAAKSTAKPAVSAAKPAPTRAKPTLKKSEPAPAKAAPKAAAPVECAEYQGVMQALRRFTEACGEPKEKVWEDFKKKYGEVKKDDQEMCLAIIEDINLAIRRYKTKQTKTPKQATATEKEN